MPTLELVSCAGKKINNKMILLALGRQMTAWLIFFFQFLTCPVCLVSLSDTERERQKGGILKETKVTSCFFNHDRQPIIHVTTECVWSSEFSIIFHVSNLNIFSCISPFILDHIFRKDVEYLCYLFTHQFIQLGCARTIFYP